MKETIYLAGGCFWCIEAVFQRINGVMSVQSGYMGGDVDNPTYREVAAGTTGHAEVLRVEYDSEVIQLADILDVFFDVHDPTTLNRQGADVGSQYRSAIWFSTDEQRSVIEMSIIKAAKQYTDPVVTQVASVKDVPFYPAEDYHDDYYNKNTEQPYCQIVISPKLEKLEKNHSDKLQ
jgi:peptide-methionine (S)-S-oxide reductase